MEIKALNHYEQSTAESAVESRADKLNWYVLKYDTVSTEYNNTIEFKTLSDAWEEFQRTDSSYPNERIELIFSPYEDDDEFGDNIVVNYKTFRITLPGIEEGHTLDEYMKRYHNMYNSGELWDFSLDDLLHGAVERSEESIYWLIDGRCYETPILRMKEDK